VQHMTKQHLSVEAGVVATGFIEPLHSRDKGATNRG
jgi:hypothetical protein